MTRAGHEEVERLERLIVKDLQNEPASGKDRLFQSHRVRNMIDQVNATTLKLVYLPSSPLSVFPITVLIAEVFFRFLANQTRVLWQVEIYEDKDSARKDEIAALGGQTATGTNVFSAFYDRLKEVFFPIISPVLLGFGNCS